MVPCYFGMLADDAAFTLEEGDGGRWRRAGDYRDGIPPHRMVWVRVC